MKWFARRGVLVATVAGMLALTGCVGWVDDPVGDPTWTDRLGSAPVEELKPYYDLLHVGADVGKETTRLFARVRTSAPLPADRFIVIQWTTSGGGAQDHYVVLAFQQGHPILVQAAPAGSSSPMCSGAGAINGGEYSAAVPTSCLGDPSGATVGASSQPGSTGTAGWYDNADQRTAFIPAS
jgi:hypothetical protein